MSTPKSVTPSSSGKAGNGFTKLPPIITNELDRTFLTGVSEYIVSELALSSAHDADETGNEEQKFVVYQAAFDKIIEYVTAYKPILTAIKKEYEDTISAIKNGQREAVFLTGKLKAMASEPSTLRNYRRRADELEERLGIIGKDNEKLRTKLDILRENRYEREKKQKEVLEPPRKELKKDKRQIPGLTLEQSTDLSLLHNKLEKLDRQLKEMTISFKTRYVPKSKKEEFKDSLNRKVSYRDQLIIQSQQNRARQERLEIAVNATQVYNRYKPPHQTVGDAVVLAMAKAAGEKAAALLEKAEQLAQGDQYGDGREGTPSTFDEDDPSKEKEAEMMLDYIEKFNELFEDGKYEEAAIHAANSPKGILRTTATLSKFKEAKGRLSGRSPLLAFCDALMSSVLAVGVQPNENLSVECVKCALNENRLDLISHWIAQDRLTVCVEVARIIQEYCKCKVVCKCNCEALAQNVYTKLGAHKDAVISMLKQSRIIAAIEHARNKGSFVSSDYADVLRSVPSLQLAQRMTKEGEQGKQLLPVGVVVRILMSTDEQELGLQLLNEVHVKHVSSGGKTEGVRDMVFADRETRCEDWLDVVKALQDVGYSETAMELLAAVTVLGVVSQALDRHDRTFILAQDHN